MVKQKNHKQIIQTANSKETSAKKSRERDTQPSKRARKRIGIHVRRPFVVALIRTMAFIKSKKNIGEIYSRISVKLIFASCV